MNTPSERHPLRRPLLILGPLLVLLVGGYLYLSGGRYVATENAYVKASKVAISAEVEGSIAQVSVTENAHVEKGDVLFQLEQRPFEIALLRAEAELRKVRAEVEGQKSTYQEKERELALAGEDRDFAEREYRRQLDLAKQKVTSQARLDQAQHELLAAKQRIAVIRQSLAQLQAQLGGDPALPIEQQPRVLQAEADRDQAALDLQHATVLAPFSGVASNTPAIGSYVKAGQSVMSIVSDRNLWIEANFKETELLHVRPGQPVEIVIDTYRDRALRGKVTSISQATGAEFSVLPAQNATGNWVKVVQRIPVRISIEGAGLPLRAGMSAEVEVDTGNSRLSGFFRPAVAATVGEE